MQRTRSLLLLAAALLLGGTAAYLSFQTATAPETPARPPAPATPLVDVVALREDVAVGTRLEDRHLTIERWEGESRPKHFFGAVEDVIGRVALHPLFLGEAIHASRVSEPGVSAGFAALVPEGKRAVSLRVDEMSGVGGFIAPGARIDILRGSEGGDGPGTVLLEDVPVAAVGPDYENLDSKKPRAARVITVVVPVKDASKLVRAQTAGRLYFLLRNPLDDEQAQAEKAPAPKRILRATPQPASVVVETLHGTNRDRTRFRQP